jgi:hypothetical protein
MAQFGPCFRAVAFITPASVVRPMVPLIVNSFAFVSGQSVNLRFFNAVAPGLAWVAQHTPSGSLPQLIEHYGNMRLRMNAFANAADRLAEPDAPCSRC